MHKDLLLNKEDTTMTKRIYNQPEVNIAQIAALSIICASGGGSSTPDPGVPLSTFTPGATTDIQLQARRIYQRSVVNGSTLQLIATCIQGKGIHPSVLACFFFVLRRLVDDIENFFSVYVCMWLATRQRFELVCAKCCEFTCEDFATC